MSFFPLFAAGAATAHWEGAVGALAAETSTTSSCSPGSGPYAFPSS